jgi:hypothetical protein
MDKKFASKIQSGELTAVDFASSYNSDDDIPVSKITKKQMNSKESMVQKPKVKSTGLTVKEIREGDYTIKQIIESKPSKNALKEWLKIRIMELTMSDEEDD